MPHNDISVWVISYKMFCRTWKCVEEKAAGSRGRGEPGAQEIPCQDTLEIGRAGGETRHACHILHPLQSPATQPETRW